MSTSQSSRDLLLRIAHCPNIDTCVNGKTDHPCNTIVKDQANSGVSRQIPEPWNGDLQQAPILFLSSNPSISSSEVYPTREWSQDRIANFFNHRFGGDTETWIDERHRTLHHPQGASDDRARDSTTYSRGEPVQFLSSVHARAKELMPGTEPIAGLHYALSEVVHCKSRSEKGVKEAVGECAHTWLEQVLTVSGANLIVLVGALARNALRVSFPALPRLKTGAVIGPVALAGRERMIVCIPHPNARAAHRLKDTIAPDLDRVQTFLRPVISTMRPVSKGDPGERP